MKIDFGSAYGIAQRAFAGVRPRLCRAQNALSLFVSYHRTPSLFVDFAISFAINVGGVELEARAFEPLFGLLLSKDDSLHHP